MSTDRGGTERSVALQVLGAMTGATALVIGVLYITGILVTSAELWHEDISLRDTIPLIPLQQLLSRGVSLVVPMLGVLVVAIALYALNVWAEGVVAKVATDALGQAAKLDEKARKSIEKADWGVVANALKTARDATEDDDHRTPLGRARRRVLLVHFSQNVVFSVLFFVLAFFVPPVPAAALVVTGIALGLLGARPAEQLLAVGYGILLLAVVLNPWLDPRPLPTATVSRASGKPVTGKLLFVADGAWYIAKSGSLTVVPGSQLISSHVDYPRGRRSVLQIILDSAKDDEPSGRSRSGS